MSGVLVKLGDKIKTLFFVLFGLVFFWLAFANTQRIDGKLYGYAVIYLAAVLLFSCLIYKIRRRWLFLLALAVLAITLRLIWIFYADTDPVSDFSLLNKAANLILEGRNSELKAIEYFNVWVYQLGFSVYCAVLYLLFGSNILVVKVSNVIMSLGITILIYFIAAKIFNEKAARISSFLYAIYIHSIIINSLYTNQVVSAFFIYLGILIIVYGKGWANYLFSGISIAIGHIMRPEGSFTLCVVAVGLVLCNIAKLLKQREIFSRSRRIKSSDIVSMLSKIAVFAFSFILIVQLFSYVLKALDITDYNFGNRNVYWKFMVGLNPSTNGGYSEEDVKILLGCPVGEDLYRLEKDIIRNRLSNKRELIELMVRKFNAMWVDNDSTIYFAVPGTTLTADKENLIIRLEKIQYSLVMFLVCITVILSIKNKRDDWNLLIIMLLITANFAIYLFIEIQTRYRYFILPSFFILCGYGLAAVAGYMDGVFKLRRGMEFRLRRD